MAFETVKIAAFRGIDQSRGLYGDAGTSPDALNMICRRGEVYWKHKLSGATLLIPMAAKTKGNRNPAILPALHRNDWIE